MYTKPRTTTCFWNCFLLCCFCFGFAWGFCFSKEKRQTQLFILNIVVGLSLYLSCLHVFLSMYFQSFMAHLPPHPQPRVAQVIFWLFTCGAVNERTVDWVHHDFKYDCSETLPWVFDFLTRFSPCYLMKQCLPHSAKVVMVLGCWFGLVE